MNDKRAARELNPEANAYDHPEVADRKRAAAGIGGVLHAMDFAIRQNALLPLWVTNKPGGVDCPGCAWPDPAPGEQKIVEFCENGAKAVAEETTGERCTPEFFAEHSIEDMRAETDYWLGRQGRLTTPMILRPGESHYSPITYGEAFDIIAEKMGEIEPDEAVFYTSGRTSNEAAYMYQLMARRLGTNNLPDCSNMCHESSGAALGSTIGIGKGTVTLDDIHNAGLIITVGQNPGTNHPRMLAALEQQKRNGGKIVAINPLPEAGLLNFRNPQAVRGVVGEGTALADEYMRIRLNGDLAFFQALNRELIRRDALDHEFLDEYCTGVEETIEHLKNLNDDDYAAATGLRPEAVTRLADMVEEADGVIVCWAMGTTQHKNSVPTLKEIVNFLLLTGNMGKPGAGACPVRGHSNVQGDRTMGIWERPPEPLLARLDKEFGFTSPRKHGYDVVNTIRAARDGKVKLFMAMGGNFVRATPDTLVTEEAMSNVELTVHVSTKLNGSHLINGGTSIILPALARTDQDMQNGVIQSVTVEDSMGMVHTSTGRRTANPGLMSEPRIVGEIAHRAFGDPFWLEMAGDYTVIRRHIENTIPGFADYETRIQRPGGFALPNGPRERNFSNVPAGKATLTPNTLEVLRVPEGHLILQTLRSHDQYNTTIYGLDDRYRGIYDGRRVVFVNPDDCRDLGLNDGDLVDIVSVWEDGERRAPTFRVVEYDTAKGCAAAYFPETNVLIPLDSTAETSNTPTSKSIIVRFEPAA
ncbi:MAG: FdhF/YdeP family oxidoreductase [Bowdeniella nasicola]|nr:FdhF/YdeP family oxidoreductase [Bowdeniella nasicola]